MRSLRASSQSSNEGRKRPHSLPRADPVLRATRCLRLLTLLLVMLPHLTTAQAGEII
ncbi:hypothetical protein PoB_004187700, partial [Plakobranchus ocellatus]